MDEERSELLKKMIPVIIALVVLGILIWGAVKFFSSLSSQVPPPKKEPQQIKLVAPPPPPPPPPPPEIEEPPEPEDEPEPEEPEPEPEPDDSPEPDQADDLDAASDELVSDAAVGNCTGPLCLKKGKPKCTVGCGKGDAAYTRFAGSLKQALTRMLSDDESVRKSAYNVIVEVWITEDGRIERANLVKGTGDSKTDDALELALSGGKRLGLVPPEGMPQPVKLRVVSRI